MDDTLIKAISKFIYDKNSTDFDVKIVKVLSYIYNEIDLVNPYLVSDYDLIDKNIMKYGLKKEELDKFKSSLTNYMNTQNFDSFLTTYKILIDMIVKKYSNVFITDEEVKQYEKIFFEGKTVQALKDYWDNALYKINNKIILSEVNENVFNPYIYYMQGKTMTDLKEMSNDNLIRLNTEILRKYNLSIDDKNLTNKINKIVDKALNPIGPLSTGNGFVDFMMILGFVATEILVGILIAIQIMKR